jgi:hypothetical protein
MADFVRVPETDWQNIVDAVRDKTGSMEKMVSGAVATEIASIGGGGSGLAYDMGEFMLDTDRDQPSRHNGYVPHSLGEIPKFVLVWTDDFSGVTSENLSPYSTATVVGYVFFDGLTNMTQAFTSKTSAIFPIFVGFRLDTNGYRLYTVTPSSDAYGMQESELPNVEKIGLPRLGNGIYWRAGVRYKYFVSKAWWEVNE